MTYRDEKDQLKKHKQNQCEDEVGPPTFSIKLRYGWIMPQIYREGIEGWLESVKSKKNGPCQNRHGHIYIVYIPININMSISLDFGSLFLQLPTLFGSLVGRRRFD